MTLYRDCMTLYLDSVPRLYTATLYPDPKLCAPAHCLFPRRLWCPAPCTCTVWQMLVVGTSSGGTTSALLDVNTGAVMHTRHATETVADLVVSADLQSMVSCSGAEFRRHDPRTGEVVFTWLAAGYGCSRLALSGDGQRALSVGDGTHDVWDTGTGRHLQTLAAHDAGAVAVALSPDGRLIAAGGPDGAVHLWRAGPAEEEAPVARAVTVSQAAVVPGGLDPLQMPGLSAESMATGEGFAGPDALFAEKRAAEPQVRQQPAAHNRAVIAVAVSPDGRWAVSYSSDSVAFWETATGRLNRTVTTAEAGAVLCAAFAPDGQRVVTGGMDRQVKLWDADGRVTEVLSGHGGHVRAVAFSPDGAFVASGGSDRTVLLWKPSPRPGLKLLHTYWGHHADVATVAFSPDGSKIVSGCDDGTLIVWTTVRPAWLWPLLSIGGPSAPRDSPSGRSRLVFCRIRDSLRDRSSDRPSVATAIGCPPTAVRAPSNRRSGTSNRRSGTSNRRSGTSNRRSGTSNRRSGTLQPPFRHPPTAVDYRSPPPTTSSRTAWAGPI